MTWKLKHRLGEVYTAEFQKLEKSDLPKLKKSYGWTRGFDWNKYLDQNNPFIAYKLVVVGDNTIQGLVALTILDGYVEIDLIEKAPHNRGITKEFTNVGDILFGFACKISYENKCDGFVLLYAKTRLVEHYIKKYGMQVLDWRSRKMVINSVAAKHLIEVNYLQRS